MAPSLRLSRAVLLFAVLLATGMPLEANYPGRDRRGNNREGADNDNQRSSSGNEKRVQKGNGPQVQNGGNAGAGGGPSKFQGGQNLGNALNNLQQQNGSGGAANGAGAGKVFRGGQNLEKFSTGKGSNATESNGALTEKNISKNPVLKRGNALGGNAPGGNAPGGGTSAVGVPGGNPTVGAGNSPGGIAGGLNAAGIKLDKRLLGKDPKLVGKLPGAGQGQGQNQGQGQSQGQNPGGAGATVGAFAKGEQDHHKQDAHQHAQHLLEALHDHDGDHWHGQKFNWAWNPYNTLHHHHHHGYWLGGVWYAPLILTRQPTAVYLPVAQPVASGRRWLGVTYEAYAGGGAFVTGVYEGSPAQAAGIVPGDVLLTLDEYDATDLPSAVHASTDPVAVVVMDGRTGEVTQKDLFLTVPF